jgi:large subunit ribosomal protein L6
MSRVGKHPVAIPAGVEFAMSGARVTIKGKLGELCSPPLPDVDISVEDSQIWVRPSNDGLRARAMWGTARSVIANMVVGVSEGFSKRLDINGVGYRAAVEGKVLKLQLGYSHDILYPIPEDLTITCERPNQITVAGADRQRVGQAAAEIRAFRKPEPYKGKGIKYADEWVRRKEGKKK